MTGLLKLGSNFCAEFYLKISNFMTIKSPPDEYWNIANDWQEIKVIAQNHKTSYRFISQTTNMSEKNVSKILWFSNLYLSN